tara:strand:- start:6222 stop:6563 length:342 start_codon:yes stop_codon:yes gene_type:complete
MTRYINRKIAINSSEAYKNSDILEKRGIKKISQYTTPKFPSYTKEEYDEVAYDTHIWTNGDRFWKLSNIYYGDPTLWWVIARWNFTPTEAHLTEGDEIRIPRDLRTTMELIRG